MVDYKTAWDEFLLRLALDSDVQLLAKTYGVTSAEVVRRLKPYIKVNYFRDKSVKKIRIDYTDSQSGINVKSTVTYSKS